MHFKSTLALAAGIAALLPLRQGEVKPTAGEPLPREEIVDPTEHFPAAEGQRSDPDRSSNSWISMHLMCDEADSCLRSGSGQRCSSHLRKILDMVDGDPGLESHPRYGRAADLYVEALADSPGVDWSFEAAKLDKRPLGGYALVSIASRLRSAGLDSLAAKFLLKAASKDLGRSGAALFDELMSSGFADSSPFSGKDARALLECAMRHSLKGSAEKLLNRISSLGEDGYEIQILEGRILESTGEQKEALKLYRRLFRSQAPPSVKKEALARTASIEFRTGEKVESAESHRIFGLYYPGDKRAGRALDTSARILVMQNDWEGALKIWEEMRRRGIDSYVGSAAIVSEAVLLLKSGRADSAYSILRKAQKGSSRRTEPAVLYWMHRAGGAVKGGEWKKRLLDEYPMSLYSRALVEGDSLFIALPSRKESKESLLLMESLEMVSFEEAFLPRDTSCAICDHPAWGAVVFFAARGRHSDAEEYCRVLADAFRSDPESLQMLFGIARKNDMVGFSTWLVNSRQIMPEGGIVPATLRYPVAFTSILEDNAIRRKLPPELILGVIREESSFERKAVSRSGAVGLMQLMPSTGSWIGKKIGWQPGAEDLLDPRLNIEAGAWYLRFLLDRNGGSIVGALAAYNAGASRISEWFRMFEPAKDPIAALEMIGIEETREYVRKVLDSMMVYRELAKGNSAVIE